MIVAIKKSFFSSSVVRFSSTNSHIFVNNSSVPFCTAQYQAVVLFSALANNNLLFISSIVRFSLDNSHISCKVSSLPPCTYQNQKVFLINE